MAMVPVKTGQRRLKSLVALGFVAILVAPWVVSAQAVNVIRDVRAVGSGVDIEVHSTREFPVRANVVVLRIGGKEFMRSRYHDDGTLNTLIFTMTPEEYARLKNGDPVSVYYGRGETGDRWDFGALNKATSR